MVAADNSLVSVFPIMALRMMLLIGSACRQEYEVDPGHATRQWESWNLNPGLSGSRTLIPIPSLPSNVTGASKPVIRSVLCLGSSLHPHCLPSRVQLHCHILYHRSSSCLY